MNPVDQRPPEGRTEIGQLIDGNDYLCASEPIQTSLPGAELTRNEDLPFLHGEED
ncbi:hypothetical protein [Actinoplanes sp. G11-F43]|uniref:hypothetical protein n=1 Tax=Actinoplanes sp. G11-F43 TaxID=3424130 RepID=UPI003D3500FC